MHKRRHGAGMIVYFTALILIASLVISATSGCGKAVEKSKKSEPEFVQCEIYCGRSIPAGGEVSEEQFAKFLDEVVTPAFPLGMTVYDAYGQMQNTAGVIVRQKTKVLILVFEKSETNEKAVAKIIDTYRRLAGGAQIMKTNTTIKPEFFTL